MIPTPLHPAVVHFPLVLALLLPIFAIGAAWAIARGRTSRAIWAIPFALSLMLFISAFVALKTGQQEEERVEKAVAERVIKEHEEAAEQFLIAGGILALISAAGLLRGRFGGGARALGTAGAVAMVLLAFHVGKAGGELVYKHGAAQAYVTGSSGAAEGGQAGEAAGEPDDD